MERGKESAAQRMQDSESQHATRNLAKEAHQLEIAIEKPETSLESGSKD